MRDFIVKILVKLGLYHKVVAYINRIKFNQDKKKMKKHGLEMLEAAENAFEDAGVRAFLTYGCLLGAYREHGFISYDPDIDLGIMADQMNDQVTEALARHGFILERANYLNNEEKTVIEQTFNYKGIHLDVFHHFREGDDFYSIVQQKHETKDWKEANNSDGFPNVRCYVPACEFEKRDFLGLKIWMPTDAPGWLKALYGETFMTPINNWGPEGCKTRRVDDPARSYRRYY